ncbi:molecular chaperone DnaJ, partial [Acinetobacter baumannii]
MLWSGLLHLYAGSSRGQIVMRIDELIQQSQWTPLLRSSDNIYFC